MKEFIDFEAGMAFMGNVVRIEKVMKQASMGKPVTLAFLGGSITQGSLSSTPETCYAALVTKWWKEQFPETEFTCINAGIGGTTSQFGVARVEDDVLKYQPDFVVIEFSVNDDNSPFFQETYEGLVRRVYGADCAPAVLLVHNVMYADGKNAQEQHEAVGRYYDIPCVSMKTSVYPAVASGKIPAREIPAREIPVRDITPDGLHPNDAGHRLLADLIIHFLEKPLSTYCQNNECENPECQYRTIGQEPLPAPMTANAYEHSVRYQAGDMKKELPGDRTDSKQRQKQGVKEELSGNLTDSEELQKQEVKEELSDDLVDSEELQKQGVKEESSGDRADSRQRQKQNVKIELSGFTVDTEPQHGITDVFKNGFIGRKKGDSVTFTVEGTGIAVQYRRSVKHPACVAKAVVDGDEEKAVILDGNFDEIWGDSLSITTLAYHIADGEHTVTVTVTDGSEDFVPFYLVSVIASK